MRVSCALGIAILLAAMPGPGAAQCMLCAPADKAENTKPAAQPIQLQIETNLDYSKLGLMAANRGGIAILDPATGQRILNGSLVDLGGLPVVGTVTVRGTPHQKVRIDLPANVTLTSSDGSTLRLSEFATTLKNNPRLDWDGTLRFTFGARLIVDGRNDGDFRGTIPITVDYN